MNKKFLIAGVAGSLVSLLGGFLVHAVILHSDYAQLPNLMRTEADAQGHLPFLLFSHLIKGFAFAWIYERGISPGVAWLTQGIRFGIAAVCLVTIPLYLVYYSVEPMPGMLVAKQIAFDSIGMILMAIVVAFIYKSSATSEDREG